MPGFSPTMSLKGDPDMHVMGVLKRYGQLPYENKIIRSFESEPSSPGAMKKNWLSMITGADYYDIDLKDPTTWGDLPDDVKMPPDQFFADLYQAMWKDVKRREKRASYEF